jgi:hypothetical protein
MKINRYIPFAFIYFFINSLALPFGLTYTALLAPLFYIWILQLRKKEILLPFIAIMAPFVILHLVIVKPDLNSYAVSFLNLTLVYVFCQAVYTFLKVCDDPEKIFRQILILNFILCLIAIPFYFLPYYELFWLEQNVTKGLKHFRRLRLFTYEPSYYASLFIPIFFFYLLQYFFRQNKMHGGLLLAMIFLPLVLSFSVGVIGAALIAGVLTWIIYFRRLTKKRRIVNAIIYSGALVASIFSVMVLFFRNNPVFLRARNILEGGDTSAKGRTDEAFLLAGKLLNNANEYWGIGLGQIKIVGESVIRSFYLYYDSTKVAIPNAAAETLVIFGWVGFSLRIFVEVFLFFYTRTWSNYYRLLLFLFMFIYQFTGSFITNVAEYVIWILAFTNVFRQFDVKDSGSRQDSKNTIGF